MTRHVRGQAGHGRTARLARWLGVDRNPLRRGTDRVEAALRLTLIILLVAAVPAAAVAAGRQADHLARHWAQDQRSANHLVTAVLLRVAPAPGSPDPYTSIQGAWVPARWQLAGQPPRTGLVFAVAGPRKGSTVGIWTAPPGALTVPPLGHRNALADACFPSTATSLVSGLVLLRAWP